jgi:uncharacterized membrane protein YcaP (DUF421 family)
MFRCLVLTYALTRHELMTALRESRCDEIDEMHAAFLESDDKISVIPKNK